MRNLENRISRWLKMDNAEVMGAISAQESKKIADFIRDVKFDDEYANAQQFTDFIESLIRGYKLNNKLSEVFISTTYDLHQVRFEIHDFIDFLDWLEDKYQDRIQFAIENNLF